MKKKVLLVILTILIIISGIFMEVNSANVKVKENTSAEAVEHVQNSLKTEKESAQEEAETKEEYISEDDLIYSNKYLVKEKTISRIDPKTSIEEFKKNIEIAKGEEIKIYNGKEEVTSGYIGTGMKVKGTKGEEYTVSVIGDITGDGIANQVELTMIIRHLVKLKDWELEGIKKESADITGDGEINLVDVSKLINYIVYGKWEKEEVKTPKAPQIKVISKKEENGEIYARLRDKDGRTGGTIKGKISNIDRLEPEKVEITRVTGDTNSIEIETKAEDKEATEKDGKSGISKYYYSIDGGTTWKPEEGQKEGIYKFENLTQNKEYKVLVKAEDKAGNSKETEIKKVTTGEIPKGTGNIEFNYNEKDWTNKNIKITLENKAGSKYKIEYSKDGEHWEEYTEKAEIEENGEIYARLKDKAGNVGKEVIEKIENIDKEAPTVALEPNGGAKYTMPTQGEAKISTTLTAEDPDKTETNGQSGLAALQYAWSQSNTEEPTRWEKFINGSKIEKADISMPGTWYLWTKVIDVAGNRAEEIKISNPFVIGSNEDPANQITLTPNTTEWTNENVIITVAFGENLSQNKTLICEGTEGTDYTINKIENKIEVKTNEKK